MNSRDMEIFKAKRDQLESEARGMSKLINDKASIEKSIDDILYLKKHAGRMVFTGQSGRSDEPENIGEVYINGLAGCVAVPALLLDLAQKRLNSIDTEINGLLGR